MHIRRYRNKKVSVAAPVAAPVVPNKEETAPVLPPVDTEDDNALDMMNLDALDIDPDAEIVRDCI